MIEHDQIFMLSAQAANGGMAIELHREWPEGKDAMLRYARRGHHTRLFVLDCDHRIVGVIYPGTT